MILQKKKVIMINDDASRSNPDYIFGIYLTAAKVAQCRLVGGNMREKEESKKETAKNTAIQKLHLQQKLSGYFQTCQYSMNSLLLSPSKEYMFVILVSLSSNTIKYAFQHIRGNLGEIPNHRM